MSDSPPATEDVDAAPSEALARRVSLLEASVAELRAKLGGFEQGRRRSTQRALIFRLLLLVLLLAGYFLMQQRYTGGLS
jgi:hypothetical protein